MTLLGMISISIACQQQNNKQSSVDEIESTVSTKEIKSDPIAYFGEKISLEGAINPEEFLAAIENNDSIPAKLSTEILATCKMKGCWMDVALGDESVMKVTFKDYGFFVPKEGAAGKETVIEGYAKTVETDVETLKHYAMDAGKSQEEIDKITEPKQEIAFVATGVIIKD